MKKALSVLAFLTFLTSFGQSEPIVNIESIKNDNRLEIRLSPDGEFDQVLSSLVFTLKWDNTIGELGDLDSSYSSYAIFKSGSPIVDDNHTYQVYVGFDMSPMSESGTSLDPICPLGSFIIDSNGYYEIVNDDITNSINGDYYISLNGEDMTGEIINEIQTGELEISQISDALYPNPFGDFFSVKSREVPKGIQIISNSGKVIYENYSKNQDIFRFDVSSVPPGSYLIRIIFSNKVEVIKGTKI